MKFKLFAEHKSIIYGGLISKVPLGIVSVASLILLIGLGANAQETMKFKSETQKLEFVQRLLNREKHLRPAEFNSNECAKMMKDMLAGRNFKAIEPDVRANSADDPKLAKWGQCRDLDEVGVSTFDGLEIWGGPPYRYYRVELDNNTENGPEDMIYYERITDEFPNDTRTAYSWVDLKHCEFKGTYPVSHRSNEPDSVSLNALVYYKKVLWILDFNEGFSFKLERLFDEYDRKVCRWSLFPEE